MICELCENTAAKRKQIIDQYKNRELFEKLRMKHTISVHIAVVVYRGKIIAEATNKLGTRSSGSGYSNWTIHAEKNVIKKLGNINRLKDSDLYVMRCSNGDKFVNSKPCPDCVYFLEKCMRKYGLRNVYYT